MQVAGGHLWNSWLAGVSMPVSYHGYVQGVMGTTTELGARRDRDFKLRGWSCLVGMSWAQRRIVTILVIAIFMSLVLMCEPYRFGWIR